MAGDDLRKSEPSKNAEQPGPFHIELQKIASGPIVPDAPKPVAPLSTPEPKTAAQNSWDRMTDPNQPNAFKIDWSQLAKPTTPQTGEKASTEAKNTKETKDSKPADLTEDPRKTLANLALDLDKAEKNLHELGVLGFRVTHPLTIDGSDNVYGWRSDPALVAAPMMILGGSLARTAPIESLGMFGKIAGNGGLAVPLGAAGAYLDGSTFLHAREGGDTLGQWKYGAALVADVGMMAPLIGMLASSRLPILKNVAVSSVLARAVIQMVPDDVIKK